MSSVYSVGQVNAYIKNMFQTDFALNNIYIKGEISNCKYHNSGHIYFTLKDNTGVISAVMFAGNRNGLKFKLEEGQKVIALGSVGVYERDGKYQLYAKQIILEGTGLLYQRFEQLKNELEEMGLFDKMYKKCSHSGYYQYFKKKKSVCTVILISLSCAGTGCSTGYCKWHPLSGFYGFRYYYRGKRRWLH